MVALRGGAFMSSAPMTPRRPWSGTKNVKKTWELARNLLREVVVSACAARICTSGDPRSRKSLQENNLQHHKKQLLSNFILYIK